VTHPAAADLGTRRISPAQAFDVVFAKSLHDPILFDTSNATLGIAIKAIG
jgi:hypothetical protein